MAGTGPCCAGIRSDHGYGRVRSHARHGTIVDRSDTIFAMPEGSGQVVGSKAYVAMSRARGAAHMIVNEAAERKAIVRKQMIGAGQPLTRPDVMRHIADNISRFIEPERASGVLRRASRIERGSFSTEPPQPSPSLCQRMR
jgi:predicted aconitase with swiveling domain